MDTSEKIQALVVLRRDVRNLVKKANSRCWERLLSEYDCLLTIFRAVANGRAQTDGGRVKAGSYGYRWSSTKCDAVLHEGDVLCEIYRSEGGSHCWMEHSRHRDATNAARALAWVHATQGRTDISVPAEALAGVSLAPCLAGDAFALLADDGSHYVRYDYQGAPTGVAVRMPQDLRSWGAWERGVTLADCDREIAHKREKALRQAREARQTAREARRIRLLARLSSKLTATYEDARNAGMCDVGIKVWCALRGIDPTGEVLISSLARDIDDRAVRVALAVARKALRPEVV